MAVTGARMPNLTQKLLAALGPGQRRALLVALARARACGLPVYLVGGSVRDLLLGRPSLDVDLVVEGDAPALAREAAAALGGRAVVHRAFGTASVRGEDFHLDLATARRERYPRPGALPQVEPADIFQDLARRDFTINAMALALTGPHQGRLLDPFGGRDDLASGLLRVLHAGSFRDDATRILRAARYAARFSLRLAEDTAAWLRRDVSYLETVSGARLRHELLRILQEERPEEALALLAAWGALARLHPSLVVTAEMTAAFRRLRRLAPQAAWPLAYLALLASPLSPEQARALASRLSLARREAEAVIGMAEALAALPLLEDRGALPSRLTVALGPLPEPCLWALSALARHPLARERVLRYLGRWRHVRPALRAPELEAMGVPRPLLRAALSLLRQARLDGRVRSARGERRLIRRWLGGVRGYG